MRSTKSSLDRDYFDRVYDRDADPWHFETSAYEREKYDATIALLGDRRFASGFEIGCSRPRNTFPWNSWAPPTIADSHLSAMTLLRPARQRSQKFGHGLKAPSWQNGF